MAAPWLLPSMSWRRVVRSLAGALALAGAALSLGAALSPDAAPHPLSGGLEGRQISLFAGVGALFASVVLFTLARGGEAESEEDDRSVGW